MENQVDMIFSVVINTMDRADSLRTLLRALEHQSYSQFEVVIVVGPTHDHTSAVLGDYAGRVRVIPCPTANLSHSRNLGLLAASGGIVAFLDDDAVPSRRWLEQLARLFRDPTLDAAGGTVYAIHPEFSPIQFRLGIYSALSAQVDVRTSRVADLVPTGMGRHWLARVMGTNMAFRREALLRIGGFDEFYGYIAEETDAIFRLAGSGGTIQAVQEAVVYHIPASSRNRQMFTAKGRWWLRSRSRLYFGIKNGLASGEPLRSIVLRTGMTLGAHWWWYAQLKRQGELSWREMFSMSAREIPSGLSGVAGGVLRRRQLLSAPAIASASPAPIRKFLTPDSTRQGAVDPVSGRQPIVSLPDAPLRICLLSSGYPPLHYDGVGRLTNLMARGLFERGHTVHVLSRGERAQISFYDGAYVHQIPNRLERYAQYRRLNNLYHALNYSHTLHDEIKRLILNDDIQIVDSPLWQTEGLVTLQSGIVPVVTRLVTGLRQINDLHQSRAEELDTLGDLEQVFLQRAAHLLPNTLATLTTLAKLYALPHVDQRSTIVPYGVIPVPEDQIAPFDLARAADERTVLFVGRLEKRKGILDLFQAIPLVLQKFPRAKFIIAGADNSHNDGFRYRGGLDYASYFAAHYPDYGARVKFMGAVSDQVLQSLYQSCDLFVAPSLYESFGLIYLEAMNYAKPVIGCCVGGIPEVVEAGVTGVLVEPQAPAALAEAIVQLLRAPEKLRELGLAGRARLLAHFTYLRMARDFERVYRQVIEEHKR